MYMKKPGLIIRASANNGGEDGIRTRTLLSQHRFDRPAPLPSLATSPFRVSSVPPYRLLHFTAPTNKKGTTEIDCPLRPKLRLPNRGASLSMDNLGTDYVNVNTILSFGIGFIGRLAICAL